MTRPSVSRALPPSRRLEPSPPDMLAELHIYLVPKEKWLETRRLAKNQVVDDAVSIGFIRVFPDISIHNLRREALIQLGPDVIPSDYVFLRSVGRNFTQVKAKQEHQLKAKNFVPPNAPEPEIYLLDVRDSSSTSTSRPDSTSLRRPVNRKREREESVKSCHVVSVHSSIPVSPSSPSPPAAPSSEDSGISASPQAAASQQDLTVETRANSDLRITSVTADAKLNVDAQIQSEDTEEHVYTTIPAMENREEKQNLRSVHECDRAALISAIEEDSCEAVTFVVLENADQGRIASPHPRERLSIEISEVLRQAREAERRRQLLVEKVTELQHRLRMKREQSQHALRDKLSAAKKAALPLEEACAGLRVELDVAHRQLVASFEGREIPLRIRDGPSKKANYKITAARLQHEIKDLQQKVNAVKVRLDSESKLRAQADREVRQLRADLSQKKLAVSALRSQMLGNLSSERVPRPAPAHLYKTFL